MYMFAVLNHSQGRQTPVVSIGVIFFAKTYCSSIVLKILRLPSGDTETPPK